MAQAQRRFHIISPPWVCGLGWFTNLLATLGIRVVDGTIHFEQHAAAGGLFWEPTGQSTYRIQPAYRAKAAVLLPSMLDREDVTFHPDLEVAYSHRIDHFGTGGTGYIVIVRDPRDAIYSTFRRDKAYTDLIGPDLTEEQAYERFLSQDHSRANFEATRVEIPFNIIRSFEFFLGYWERMSNFAPVHFFKFEDAKLEPVVTAQRLLRILEVEMDDATLARSIQLCSMESTQAAEQRSKEQFPNWLAKDVSYARRGKVNEWKERKWPIEQARFNRHGQSFLNRFGYEPYEGQDGFDDSSQPMEGDPLSAIRHWFDTERELIQEALPSGEKYVSVDLERLAVLWSIQFTHTSPLTSDAGRGAFSFFLAALQRYGNCTSVQIGAILRHALSNVSGSPSPELNIIHNAMYRFIHP